MHPAKKRGGYSGFSLVGGAQLDWDGAGEVSANVVCSAFFKNPLVMLRKQKLAEVNKFVLGNTLVRKIPLKMRKRTKLLLF